MILFIKIFCPSGQETVTPPAGPPDGVSFGGKRDAKPSPCAGFAYANTVPYRKSSPQERANVSPYRNSAQLERALSLYPSFTPTTL